MDRRLDVELNMPSQEQMKKLLEQQLRKGPLPPAPMLAAAPGDWLQLAKILEQEVENIGGFGKVVLHLDPPDALALARELRKKAKK